MAESVEEQFPAAVTALNEYRDIENRMGEPEVASNPDAIRKLGRRHAELGSIVSAYLNYKQLCEDYEVASEMASEDEDLAKEAKQLEEQIPAAKEKLRTALIPRDPDDARDMIMEIKAGTGGEEAALFAGDLLRMYMRYAEKRGWTTVIQSENSTELGGVKDVFPEADEDDDEIEIDPKDLKIDIFMSSGPGGQSVNTTYSAVRMTHIPTGIVVSMQDEKSQIQNRAAALRVLKSRLLAMKHEQEAAEAADMRHSQVRSLDRSERIRTYNFPENRIVDHRTNYKAYNLDQVLNGDLQPVIDSDIQADEADRLAKAK